MTKKIILMMFCPLFLCVAQSVSFEEYDLDNGLHVILHQDNNAPVITTSVMYHVGAVSYTHLTLPTNREV